MIAIIIAQKIMEHVTPITGPNHIHRSLWLEEYKHVPLAQYWLLVQQEKVLQVEE